MSPVSHTADDLRERHSTIGRRYERLMDWMPYATLALGTGLSTVASDEDGEAWLVTLGLVVATALWVYVMYTRMPSWETAGIGRATLYFYVMIGLGAALMSRDMLYFVFVATGFFHAGLFRRDWPTVAAIGTTAVVVNVTIPFDEGGISVSGLAIYLLVVAVQTGGVSAGYLIGEKLERLSLQSQEALVEREAALEENAGLHMQLLTQAREAGILDERQRMAREIHDTVAQGLAGIIAQLHAADAADDEARRRRHLDSAVTLARESLTEAQRTVQAIGPPTLDEAQLSEALAEESAKWSESNGVPVELVTAGEARPMHPEVEVTLLRIAQEALTNVAKHAEAGRVGITLSYMEDQLALDVRDDGLGFEPGRTKATAGNGYGLSAMRQRVGRLDGRLSIESEPGAGTVISASVPAIPQAVAVER